MTRRRHVALAACCIFGIGLSACVYRIDVQQGNYLEPETIEQVEPGMTRSQVRFLLGTPMVADPFHADRWDYVYYFKPGKRRKPESRRFTVFFEGDSVARVENTANG
ncbi:MAG: outer membrane protein assembly factor BamE [Gammaproteobacteria bacterium]|nr:outer membrane protein assembly factor BamE [Gammaproteobacteria bacterium]